MPVVDDLLAQFEKEFAGFSKAFFTRLKEQLTRGILERADIIGILDELGYNQILTAYYDEAAQRISRESAGLLRELGLTDIPDTGLYHLELMLENQTAKLLSSNQSIIDAIVESGLRYEIGGMSYKDILFDLESKVQDMTRRLSAEAHTGIRNFQRAERLILYEEGGVERFFYYGPIDNVTRDVCMEALQSPLQETGWTMADIAAGPVDFITGGGYNCRHEFLPFDKKEGESLKQRADRFEPT